MTNEHPDDFYVGYLPLTPAFRTFVRFFVPTLAVIGLGVAALVSLQQPEPSAGTWNLEAPVTLTGTYRQDPYPMIVLPADGDHPERSVLLVTMGKMGAGDDATLTQGQEVSVSGFPIGTSDGTVLLAIESPDVDLMATDASLESLAPPVTHGARALSGQIIDPKCYFGAMKPGEGKVHKACATLCIRGGIPPMFMTVDEAGERTYYLLLNESGAGFAGDELNALLPYVADPVVIEGQVERQGGMLVLKADPAAIRRL